MDILPITQLVMIFKQQHQITKSSVMVKVNAPLDLIYLIYPTLL